MVDKIDKTTLKILLFIVFLVILYLIVNRKKQIKEGFLEITETEDIYNMTRDEYILHIFKNRFFFSSSNPEHGPLNNTDGVKLLEDTKGAKGMGCSGGIKSEGQRKGKTNLYNLLKEKIDGITSSDEDDMRNEIERVIRTEVYDVVVDDGDIISQSLDAPYFDYRFASSKLGYRCEAATKIHSINYNGTRYLSYSTLIAAIKLFYDNEILNSKAEKDAKVSLEKKEEVIQSYIYTLKQLSGVIPEVTLLFNSGVPPSVTGSPANVRIAMNDYLAPGANVNDLKEVVSAEINDYIETAEEAAAVAEAAKAAEVATSAAAFGVTAEKIKMIQSYLDLLKNNGIEIVYKQAEEIIERGIIDKDFSMINDNLEKELYTSINDYYNSVISTHRLTEIETGSCSDVGKTDLSLDECKEFRRLYVPTREDSSADNFGTYPGISKMTSGVGKDGSGSKYRFTEENDYVYSQDGWQWLSIGCQYRHDKDNDQYNGLYYSKNGPRENGHDVSKRRNLTLLCKEKEKDPIADAVTALLDGKKVIEKSISIGKQYLNIFKKIIEGYDFGEDTTIFEKIIEELDTYHKIDKEVMANSDDTEFIYPNCEAKNMISLNKKECSNFRKEYVSDTATAKDKGYGSMLTDNTNGHFTPENGYMRLGVDNGNWMPKGCSYRAGGDKGIHYSDNNPDYTSKRQGSIYRQHAHYGHISKFDLFCKIDINKLNKLKTLSSLITESNNSNFRDILESILKLLDTENPLTDVRINEEITKLQGYVDTHIENEKKKLTSKERITLENSFNLI